MLRKTASCLIALCAATFAAPLAAQQSANDYQLPANSQPTAAPRVQGPVDAQSGPLVTRPRATQTATPTVNLPAPTVTAAPTPAPTTAAAATTAQGQRAQAQRPATQASTSPVPPSSPSAQPPASPEPQVLDTFPSSQPSTIAPAAPATGQTYPPAAAEPAVAAEKGSSVWLYLAIAALVLAALGFALWRRHAAPRAPIEIERPVVASVAPVPAASPADALTLVAEATRVTRSFAFATVDYRLTIVNRQPAAQNWLQVGVDVISASAGAPVENQLAGPGTDIPLKHEVERLGPSQSLRLEGQVRLPLGEVQVIRQGRAALLVPLLRVRVARTGAEGGALTKTFVIGQGVPGAGGRVQPFNLDDGPRAYTAVAQRELA